MKFKKPKNGHFFYYCFECSHWEYQRTAGCANLGICKYGEPSEQDAYDKPCEAFKKKGKTEGAG